MSDAGFFKRKRLGLHRFVGESKTDELKYFKQTLVFTFKKSSVRHFIYFLWHESWMQF